MSGRPTYSLQFQFGVLTALAVATGAFGAPQSLITGLLVLILATCTPGLLAVVWRSGAGYRRSFVLGAAAPSVVCAYRFLSRLHLHQFNGASMRPIVEFAGNLYRWEALTMLTVAFGGGLLGLAVHWFMAAPSARMPPPRND